MVRLTRSRVFAAVLLVVCIGLIGVGVSLAVQRHYQSNDEHQKAQVLQAARAEVLALTDISATTTDKEIGVLLAGMTAHLKGQFAPQADAFRQAMITNKVQSHGRVVATGVTAISDRSATVIVAAAATVSNSRTSGTQDRSYRLKLGLEKVSGHWLVDSMEFVP